MTVTALPESLAEIRDEFLELPEPDRLQLLLEFSRELPPVPAQYDGHPELCERVAECQSPVYIVMDVDDRRASSRCTPWPRARRRRPAGSPASSCRASPASPRDEVLAIPADFPQSIGLTRAVSPLRIAGMTGMLMRAKRQVRAKLAVVMTATADEVRHRGFGDRGHPADARRPRRSPTTAPTNGCASAIAWTDDAVRAAQHDHDDHGGDGRADGTSETITVAYRPLRCSGAIRRERRRRRGRRRERARRGLRRCPRTARLAIVTSTGDLGGHRLALGRERSPDRALRAVPAVVVADVRPPPIGERTACRWCPSPATAIASTPRRSSRPSHARGLARGSSARAGRRWRPSSPRRASSTSSASRSRRSLEPAEHPFIASTQRPDTERRRDARGRGRLQLSAAAARG